jgi:CO dehydrogenase/acetyl-CoA synthase beta subunit
MISFDFEIDEINEVYEFMKKKKIRTIKTWKQISVEDFEEIVKEEFQLERVMKSVLLGLHKKVLA